MIIMKTRAMRLEDFSEGLGGDFELLQMNAIGCCSCSWATWGCSSSSSSSYVCCSTTNDGCNC